MAEEKQDVTEEVVELEESDDDFEYEEVEVER